MAIIPKNYGVRLYLKDAISYDMRMGESRITALIHAIFGRKVTTKEAEDFKKANPDYLLNKRIDKKLEERGASLTQARPPMQKAYIEQHSSSHSTKKPNTATQPTDHEVMLFEDIKTALKNSKQSIEELEGLSSLEVLEKLRTMEVMSHRDWEILKLNKGAADYGKLVDYVRNNPT